jgi:CHAT domain-containing protein
MNTNDQIIIIAICWNSLVFQFVVIFKKFVVLNTHYTLIPYPLNLTKKLTHRGITIMQAKTIYLFSILFILFSPHWAFSIENASPNFTSFSTYSKIVQQGEAFFQQGDYSQAIVSWENALRREEFYSGQYIDLIIRLATAYQAVGHYNMAHAYLQQIQSMVENEGSAEQQVLFHSVLGDILLAMQDVSAAKKQLESYLTPAQQLNNPLMLAHLLNNLGNVYSIEEDYAAALKNYQQAADLAQQHSATSLYRLTLNNQIQLFLEQEDITASIATLETALAEQKSPPTSYQEAFDLLNLGELVLRIQTHPQFSTSTSPSLAITTYQLLTQVQQASETLNNGAQPMTAASQRLNAYAYGLLGQLYEQQQREQEALKLTRQAIFYAQNFPEIRYLWEWQLGRLLQAQKQLVPATSVYQQALSHLQPIRIGLTIGQRDPAMAFKQRIRPVYFGLADVLLQQAALETDSTKKQSLLFQAQEVLENLKLAELQDYFQDECVSVRQEKVTELEVLGQKTAIFYPVLLNNRIELLLTIRQQIYQFVIPITSQTLEQTILTFRENLQHVTTYRFVQPAKQLYNWLIAPLEKKLQQHSINTLVVVPDGALRTIPLSALYNSQNNQFLVEQFAIATLPALMLTEPRPLPRKNVSVSLNGLSKGVQDFDPLPSVPNELKKINALFKNSTVLLDQDFLLNNLNHVLKREPYSIVHIASHGQFDRDPKKTFLLTYDDKLTMNRLTNLFKFSELRKEAVELLTLSACQTAVGDERAALGLAGVAIKAGARSAVASLWFVNDESTSQLISEFYHQLQNPALSKAQALQNAQKKLYQQRTFQHPAYWSPFLLIGNWL